MFLVSQVLALTTEQDAFKKTPSLANFYKLDKPTVLDFGKLNIEDQADYLLKKNKYNEEFAKAYLNKLVNFNSVKSKLVGDEFFIHSNKIGNVNDNKNSFQKYMVSKYKFGSFLLEKKSKVVKFDGKNFETTGKAASSISNIHQLSGKKITIKEDGKIIVSGAEFEGLGFSYDQRTGSFSNKGSGRINGYSFSNGEGIKVFIKQKEKYGVRISGYFDNFKGVKFNTAGQKYFVLYHSKTNTLHCKDAIIDSVSLDTNINIKGSKIILPDGNKDGNFDELYQGSIYYENGKPRIVKENSNVMIMGVRHKTKKNSELNLIYGTDYVKTVPITRKSVKIPEGRYFKFIRIATDTDGIEEELRKELLKKYVGIKTTEQIDQEVSDLMNELEKRDFSIIRQKEILPISYPGGKGFGGMNLMEVLAKKAKGQKIKFDLKNKNERPPILSFPRKMRINGNPAWLEYDSKKGQWDYVYREQDLSKISSKLNKDKNYFGYLPQTEQAIVKGKDFTSTFTPQNNIFEATDYGFGETREYNIKVTPKKGEVQIKPAPYEFFLALGTKVEGKAEIENGNWKMDFDGKKVYGRPLSSGKLKQSEIVPDGADMLISYQNKRYQLDVDRINPAKRSVSISDFYSKVDKDNVAVLNQKVKEKVDGFNNQHKKTLTDLNKRMEEIKKKILQKHGLQSWFAYEDSRIQNFDAELKKARAAGKDVSEILRKRFVVIQEIAEKQKKVKIETIKHKEHVKIVQRLKELDKLRTAEVKDFLEEIKKINTKYHDQFENSRRGMFYQKIKTSGGEATYAESVDSQPVIFNSKSRTRRYGQQYGQAHVHERGYPVDVLVLDVPKNQECIDTQMRLRYEWLVGQKKNVEFVFPIKGGKLNLKEWKKGSYKKYRLVNNRFVASDKFEVKWPTATGKVKTAKSYGELKNLLIADVDYLIAKKEKELKKKFTKNEIENTKKLYLKRLERKYPKLQKSNSGPSYLNAVMGWTGTKTYQSLYQRKSLEKHVDIRTHPSQIKPGDILVIVNVRGERKVNPERERLAGGHALGIKEVIETADGKRYLKIFAGSQPAHDARIYESDLVPLGKGEISGRTFIYGWKNEGSKSEVTKPVVILKPKEIAKPKEEKDKAKSIQTITIDEGLVIDRKKLKFDEGLIIDRKDLIGNNTK